MPAASVVVERNPAAARARARRVTPASAPETRRRPATARWIAAASAVAAVATVVWLGRPLVLGGPVAEPTPAPVAAPPPVSQTAGETPQMERPDVAAQVPAGPTQREEPTAAATRATSRVTAQDPPASREPTVTAPMPVAKPAEQVIRPEPEPVAPPVPALGTIRGVVRDAASNTALAGVQLTIPGTAFTATTDANGVFTFSDVPAGNVSVVATAAQRPVMSRDVRVETGGSSQIEFLLAGVPRPVALEPDDELSAGGWLRMDLDGAAAALGVPLAVIDGLFVESIATPDGGSRPRVRIAHLTPSGQRIVLTETRSGAPVPSGNPRVTALRIIPASQTYPLTTGTASFGNLLVTAKAAMPGDSLRTLLADLVVARPDR
jgi:hypothetical protein